MRDVDFLDRLADQDAGGVDAGAGLALGLEDRDRKPAGSGGPCRGKAGKAGADDDEIEIHVALLT